MKEAVRHFAGRDYEMAFVEMCLPCEMLVGLGDWIYVEDEEDGAGQES